MEEKVGYRLFLDASSEFVGQRSVHIKHVKEKLISVTRLLNRNGLKERVNTLESLMEGSVDDVPTPQVDDDPLHR